jgi:hypothetical protein
MGWGLEPVSTEGWIVTLAFAAVAFFIRRTRLGPRWVRYAMGGAFLLFAFLKGSAPGGAGARADFEAAKATAAATA